jgi:hypothetical protein
LSGNFADTTRILLKNWLTRAFSPITHPRHYSGMCYDYLIFLSQATSLHLLLELLQTRLAFPQIDQWAGDTQE